MDRNWFKLLERLAVWLHPSKWWACEDLRMVVAASSSLRFCGPACSTVLVHGHRLESGGNLLLPGALTDVAKFGVWAWTGQGAGYAPKQPAQAFKLGEGLSDRACGT